MENSIHRSSQENFAAAHPEDSTDLTTREAKAPPSPRHDWLTVLRNEALQRSARSRELRREEMVTDPWSSFTGEAALRRGVDFLLGRREGSSAEPENSITGEEIVNLKLKWPITGQRAKEIKIRASSRSVSFAPTKVGEVDSNPQSQ